MQQTEPRPGDVVLVHTGWLKDPKNRGAFVDTEPGIGSETAAYLVEEKGVVAIGSDNWALEVIPAADAEAFLPVHGYLLREKGVHIIENVWTIACMSSSSFSRRRSSSVHCSPRCTR